MAAPSPLPEPRLQRRGLGFRSGFRGGAQIAGGAARVRHARGDRTRRKARALFTAGADLARVAASECPVETPAFMRDKSQRPPRKRPASPPVRPLPFKAALRPEPVPESLPEMRPEIRPEFRPETQQLAQQERLPALSPTAARELVAQKLSGFADITWDWSRIQAFTLERINQIITARGVPAEDLTAPRLDIAVPAIEAMRYSALKDEMAVLIASTMDARLAHEAHPAFIEIIKQLTLDEVHILSALPPAGQVLPMVNITYVDRGDRVFSSLRYVIPERIAMTCAARRPIPSYIDNLLRLNLIASPSNLGISEERPYRDLLAQTFIADMDARQPAHIKAEIERRVITLTDFGDKFRRCCLDGDAVAG